MHGRVACGVATWRCGYLPEGAAPAASHMLVDRAAVWSSGNTAQCLCVNICLLRRLEQWPGRTAVALSAAPRMHACDPGTLGIACKAPQATMHCVSHPMTQCAVCSDVMPAWRCARSHARMHTEVCFFDAPCTVLKRVLPTHGHLAAQQPGLLTSDP